MAGVRTRIAAVVVTLVAGVAVTGCVFDTPTTEPGPEVPLASTTTTTALVTGAAAAVAYAKAQVGRPYCYAGIGPACFDCSGLTYMAWKKGGITIPRTSGAQYTKYPKIALTALQPGDLLFPADPNQHVAIYIGAGRMVHATKTGDFIKNVLMSTYPVKYAVRPR